MNQAVSPIQPQKNDFFVVERKPRGDGLVDRSYLGDVFRCIECDEVTVVAITLNKTYDQDRRLVLRRSEYLMLPVSQAVVDAVAVRPEFPTHAVRS